MDTIQAIHKVNLAVSATDIFGPYGDSSGKDIYKSLVKALYPDMVDNSLKDSAEEAFKKLSTLWDSWCSKTAAPDSFEIPTRRYTYKISGLAYQGSIANLYYSKRDDQNVLVKIPRSPRNSDLIVNERNSLKKIADGKDLRPFFPKLIDSVKFRDNATKAERQVNILSAVEGFYTLAEVKAVHNNLDPRDAAWIWRRLLYALGYIGSLGLVHGAILPENILIHPIGHGVIVAGWSYSVEVDSKVLAIVSSHKDLYAPEILNKQSVDPSTDIYMASKLMEWLVGNLPRPLRAFVRGCTLEKQKGRPYDGSMLQKEFDELIERMWGPRKYRPLNMPT